MGPRTLIPYILLFAATAAQAAPVPTRFALTPQNSNITFTAVVNHGNITGHFANFGGQVLFDPKALDKGYAKVEIELASVASDSADTADNLKTPDWFDTGHYPKAIFEVHSFATKGGDQYTGTGQLSLKGINAKVPVTFTVHERTENGAYVTGEAVLSRTSFHVGWKDTSNVEDAVKITFELHAKPM